MITCVARQVGCISQRAEFGMVYQVNYTSLFSWLVRIAGKILTPTTKPLYMYVGSSHPGACMSSNGQSLMHNIPVVHNCFSPSPSTCATRLPNLEHLVWHAAEQSPILTLSRQSCQTFYRHKEASSHFSTISKVLHVYRKLYNYSVVSPYLPSELGMGICD